MRSLIRSFALVGSSLATLMGLELSVLVVVVVCPRRAATSTRAVSIWRRLLLQVLEQQVIARIRRALAAHWGRLGNQLKATPDGTPGRASTAQHWGQLGYRLRANKARIRIASLR